jgi:hypothetical protein
MEQVHLPVPFHSVPVRDKAVPVSLQWVHVSE